VGGIGLTVAVAVGIGVLVAGTGVGVGDGVARASQAESNTSRNATNRGYRRCFILSFLENYICFIQVNDAVTNYSLTESEHTPAAGDNIQLRVFFYVQGVFSGDLPVF
jgi:hypothetical protein